MNNINGIGEKCCGCQACISVCPRAAIKTIRGVRGELLCKADDTCINCGKCVKVCAALNVKLNNASSEFFKVRVKNKKILSKSSSGGIGYVLSDYFLANNGLVFGAAWDEDSQKVKHIKIDSMDELYKLQGSKYVQSLMDKSIYKDISELVKTKKILFIGCPCQVSAVKNVAGCTENLYCIDLVCHGVPSSELLNEQLKAITKSKIKNLSFREGLSFKLDIEDVKKKKYSILGYDNPYYVLFLTYTSLRECCYNCSYARRERVGDITIGDYVENNQGYSCVLINSQKGRLLFENIENAVYYEKRNADLLITNVALNHPTQRNKKVDSFSARYNKRGLKYAYYRTFPVFVIKRIVRKLLGDRIYECLKRGAYKDERS